MSIVSGGARNHRRFGRRELKRLLSIREYPHIDKPFFSRIRHAKDQIHGGRLGPAQSSVRTFHPGARARGRRAKQAPQPSIESLEEQSRKAFAEGDAPGAYAVNLQLHERRPYNVEYMVNVVRAAALQDRQDSEAYEMMLTMQRQGLSYDFNQTDDTLDIRKTEVYQYINDLMVEAGKPAGEGVPRLQVARCSRGLPGHCLGQ